jgi:glycosyltransferase involved in cell wall biosynthesis
MHILFVHQNYPAQFGHIAAHLARNHGFRCTFVSERPGESSSGVERIEYQSQGGATERTHYFSRKFENQIWHSEAVFEALKARPDIQPDLIVGHSGFVSTLYLRELYDCPIINYFEYFYRTRNSELDFRHDLPLCSEMDRLRAMTRNAMLLLDLENCDLGYSPTTWQRDRLPKEFQEKVRVIFDGVDTAVWHKRDAGDRRIGGWTLPEGMRIVTYVSRGLEALRGFDVFMKLAHRLCQLRSDVLFLVVGEDRVAYGGDQRFTDGLSFKQWVLSQESYDLQRILFLGRLATGELARLFSLSDLHVYLTVPFVLSWSLMDALSCEATVLASDVGPVREMVRHEENGLVVDFFDLDKMTELAMKVLDDPNAFRHLGAAGTRMIRDHYSLEQCLPKMLALYQETQERKQQRPEGSPSQSHQLFDRTS